MSSDENVDDLFDDEELETEDLLDDEELDDSDESDDTDDDADGDSEENDTDDEEPKKKKRVIPFVVGALSVCLFAGGVVLGINSLKPGEQVLTDLAGNRVQLEDPSALDPEAIAEADMVENEGGKGFSIPVAGLNVNLGSINPVKGSMNPPNFTSAFWIRKRGVSPQEADKGTVVIVTHSLRAPGKAPGNYYQKDGEVILNPGDFIEVNDRVYSFVKSEVILKEELGKRNDVWSKEPGKLIVITCYQNKGGSGKTTHNVVLFGELVT
ncbi:MAG: hypothetical protein FWG15_08175 [Propionibacteriaceae bacterium]|nr:hypothetical protein [Propionibacteriaceae bacterium]